MATITSVGNGNWDVAGTWDAGVPTVNDDVIIAHTVTIRDATATCKTCTVNADKVLNFDGGSAAQKITFKDDAAAAFTVTGTLTFTNQTVDKPATILGGSKTNMVSYTGNGTSDWGVDADLIHWGYVNFGQTSMRMARRQYFDYDCKVQYLDVMRSWSGTNFLQVEPHGEDLTITVAKDKWLAVHGGGEFRVIGSATYKVYLQGADSANKMSCLQAYGRVVASYFYMRTSLIALWFEGGQDSYFENCDFDVDGNVIMGQFTGPIYFKNCTFSTDYRVFREGSGGTIAFEGCEVVACTNTESENYGPTRFEFLGDANEGFTYDTMKSLQYMHILFVKRLTVTVVDENGDSVEGAHVSLIQDHADDYMDVEEGWHHGFIDAGLTDASGQIVLHAFWRRMYFYTNAEGMLTYYYSDASNNGPSGTKEKHRLIVAKPGYLVNDENTYYMSADASASITLLAEAGAASSDVMFGEYTFPHVLNIDESNAQIFVERELPGCNVAYRNRLGATGRKWTVRGYLKEDRYNEKASMRALADGTARDFDRGTGEALVSCLMLDPEFADSVDHYGRLDYSIFLVEQENP